MRLRGRPTRSTSSTRASGRTLEGLKRQVEMSVLAPLGDVGGVAIDAATGIGTFALGMQGLGISLGDIKTKAAAFARFLVGPWGIALWRRRSSTQAHGRPCRRTRQGNRNHRKPHERRLLGDRRAGRLVPRSRTGKSRGVWETWEQSGLSLDTLRGAMMGVESDLKAVTAARRRVLVVREPQRGDQQHRRHDHVRDGPSVPRRHLRGPRTQRRALLPARRRRGVAPALQELEEKSRANDAATARLTGQAEAYGAALGESTDATGVASDAAGDYEAAMGDLEGRSRTPAPHSRSTWTTSGLRRTRCSRSTRRSAASRTHRRRTPTRSRSTARVGRGAGSVAQPDAEDLRPGSCRDRR
jgi:hypothetical protein